MGLESRFAIRLGPVWVGARAQLGATVGTQVTAGRVVLGGLVRVVPGRGVEAASSSALVDL